MEYFIFQIAERLLPPAPHLLPPRPREKTALAAAALVLPGITYSTATTTLEPRLACGGKFKGNMGMVMKLGDLQKLQ